MMDIVGFLKYCCFPGAFECVFGEQGLVKFDQKSVNMSDIKQAANPLFLREEELRQGIDLLFYAYRDFTSGPDAMLASYGFGRAHHRVIYFVGRHPEMTVTELLG